MEEASYQQLLAAYISEDPDLCSLSHYTSASFCEQIYVPFVARLCKESKIVGAFHTEWSGRPYTFPWIFTVDVMLENLKYLNKPSVLRILLSKPDLTGVGLGCTIKEHGFTAPQKVSIRIPIYFESKDVGTFSNMIGLPIQKIQKRLALLEPNRTRIEL